MVKKLIAIRAICSTTDGMNRPSIQRIPGTVGDYWRAAATAIILIVTANVPILAQSAAPPSTQSVSRIRFRVEALDNQIGILLLKLPVGSDNPATSAEMEETYRLVIRHLYQTALHCQDTTLRSRVVLKADQLSAGLMDFDNQMRALLSKKDPKITEVTKACDDFYHASQQVNNAITSTGNLNTYLHKLLKPLEPLATMEFADGTAPMVWPMMTKSRRSWPPAPINHELPGIHAEFSALQGANITPEMRQILRSILRQLQEGLNQPATRRQSQMYYGVILQCVNLAEHLQQGTVLPEDARSQFNHRLMLGLLFFKDPRTRAAAARKLEFISTVVHSMELLQTTVIPAGDQRELAGCMHDTISKLQKAGDGGKYANRLHQLDDLLAQQQAFTQLIDHPHAAYANTAWQRISKDGKSDLTQCAIMLDKGFDGRAIQTYLRRVEQLMRNINCLIAMPASARQALLYHPDYAVGVQSNMARWARQIGRHPHGTSAAVAGFERFNEVLALLAATHREMAAHGPERILKTLSAGRYSLFVKKFLQIQRDLVNSLARPELASDQLIATLNRQRIIFRTSSQLAYLLEKANPLLQLNQWAAWHCNVRTVKVMLNQFEQILSKEFRKATRARHVTSEAWTDFSTAIPAINALANACQNVVPQLNAPSNAWSSGWLQAYAPPPGNAFYRKDLSALSQACMFLNDAEFNSAQGHVEAAQQLFNRGLQVLAHH